MSEARHLEWDPVLLVPAAEAELDRRLADEAHPHRDPVVSMRRRVRARSRSYRAALPRESHGLLPDAPTAVLGRLGAARAAATAAQVAELEAAVEWAALHTTATCGPDLAGGERLDAVAGEGAPLVAEFAIPELALRLDVSTDSGRLLLGDAVELAHRLPRCWSALRAGGVAVFKARRVARATRDLSHAAAAHVDAEVAPYLHGIGVTALDGIVEAATWRHDLDRAVAEAQRALDHRSLTIDLDTPTGYDGATSTCQVFGHLDRADALELEAAVSRLAHHLHLAGSTEPLDVRRSMALGMLARNEAPVAVADQTTPDHDLAEWDEVPPSSPTLVRRRDVVLHVHLSDEALRTGTGVARVEGHSGPVAVEQVRAWCAAPGSTTRITVRPVLDLGATLSVGSYELPAALVEQTALRDRTCVFPHCARDARACDDDHVVPHDAGGPTASHNVAALCRRHHRLKTHDPGWTYRVLHPGTYLWTTPHGQRVLRDPSGTHTV